MKRLIIAANFLPAKVKKVNNIHQIEWEAEIEKSGLTDFYNDNNVWWIGQLEIEDSLQSANDIELLDSQLRACNCTPVFPATFSLYDDSKGFPRDTLWPVFHYFPQNAKYVNEDWHAYSEMNELYAEKILDIIEEGDSLWIHDYHLLLLPGMIRKKMPTISIGIFIHIPFPSYEIFRLLPMRVEILEGILGADLIGFHTYDYVRHFLSCVRRLLGYDTVFNQIRIEDRTLETDVFPLGIDYEKYRTVIQNSKDKPNELRSKIHQEIEASIKQKAKKLILSLGKLDYTKGIPLRLVAYETLLKNYPEYHEKISLILNATVAYDVGEKSEELKQEVDEIVGRINGAFGTIQWMPIWYLNHEFEQEELIELYALSDIALIVPLRDGMNLISKEYIASRPDGTGVLILSEMAGASKELHEAIIVNPNNNEEIVSSMIEALEMPEDEQIRRNLVMQKRLKRYDVKRWAHDFMKSLEGVKELQESTLTKKITEKRTERIVKAYREAEKRILFLDYDGTLAWFKKDPEDARPDSELYSLLKKLSSDLRNTLVIISGRDKETLERWFGEEYNIHFVAEHGVWNREPGSEWYMNDQIDNEWKDSIKPLLEYYVDQTPETFIEDKNFSLVWHYRKADPDLGVQRAWELKDELRILTSNLNLEIMDGDKVLEIKYAGINKGRAAINKMGEEKFDFILAFGDDWTDEYTFDALPEEAYTIKVGTKITKANFYIDSVDSVRGMLKMFAE